MSGGGDIKHSIKFVTRAYTHKGTNSCDKLGLHCLFLGESAPDKN